MRIAYVGRWRWHASDGARAKVEAQAAEWRRRGHEVELFAAMPQMGQRGLRAALVARGVVDTARIRRAVSAYGPVVIFIRGGFFVPPLRPLQRRYPSLVEINGDGRAQAAALGQRFRSLLGATTHDTVLRPAAGIVCVTHELARGVEHLGHPVRVIANGADLDIEPLQSPGAAEPLAIFLAGTLMPWHGIDKLLVLARELPQWRFALVGVPVDALEGPPPANVELHPSMPREGYARLLAQADVGIGSLAMHRAGLSEANPLKVREYLAHGLPVILGFEDTDFIGADPWFLHRLANNETNVRDGVEGIRGFVEGIRGRRVHRDEITLLDWRTKEEARLEFMAQVCARKS